MIDSIRNIIYQDSEKEVHSERDEKPNIKKFQTIQTMHDNEKMHKSSFFSEYPTLQYLSSSDLEVIQVQENEPEKVAVVTTSKKMKIIYFILANIINFIQFLFIPIILFVFGLILTFSEIIQRHILRSLLCIWILICSICVVYSQVNYFIVRSQNEMISYFLLDGLYFYLTSILVLSYLRTNYYCTNSISQIFTHVFEQSSFSTFQYLFQESDDREAYYLDYKKSDTQLENWFDDIQARGYSRGTIYFSYFKDNFDRIIENYESMSIFFSDFGKHFTPKFRFFFILITIILFKLLFCFHYIIIQVHDISKKQYADMIVMMFVYIYTTFNLNRILGNNDLRRKYAFMVKLNQFIDFKNFQDIDIRKKLDVTCPISLESWDNARKYVLSFRNEWLETLELSYFYLFLYLIFVTLVCMSNYFEFYWIFEKNSVFLNPLVVMMSTFNFLFLSAFFLIRFKEGSRFNKSFETTESCLVYLIDVMDDLITMFDFYFNQIRNPENLDVLEEKSSIYGVMIKKFKLQSNIYINDKLKYEGRLYLKNEKSQLRKDMIINTQLSLKKVKKSLCNDQLIHKYKFLNLIEINFQDMLVTTMFALVTILPTIIPKFINLFSQEQI